MLEQNRDDLRDVHRAATADTDDKPRDAGIDGWGNAAPRDTPAAIRVGGRQQLDDRQWAEYLFYRDNPKGSYAERWVHAAGCRKWFNVIRDTRTYEIQHVYRIGETPPGAAGSPPAAVTSTPSSNTPKED